MTQVLEAIAKYSKRVEAHRAGRPRARSRRARRAAAARARHHRVQERRGLLHRARGAMPTGPGTLRWLLPPRALRKIRDDQPSPTRAVVIINPLSDAAATNRRSSARRARARRARAAHGIEVRCARRPGPAMRTTFAREAVDAGCDLVVAWGGDGTINEAACALVHTDVPLRSCPAGSGNGLAADLAMPFDPRAALRTGGRRAHDGDRRRPGQRLPVLQHRRRRHRRRDRGAVRRARPAPARARRRICS